VPPFIQLNGYGSSGTNVSVSLTSVPGLSYTLEYKNSLSDSTWLPILPPISGTGNVIVLIDTNTTPVPSRFFRVSAQ
jgi:hypothetical protein